MRPLLILTCLIAMPASAHVTVWPKKSAAGAHEKYEVRLPNESKVAVRSLEVRLPMGLTLNSVEQKPGWRSELVRDTSGAVTGIRWLGELAPMEFAEFGILATNPQRPSVLEWNATEVLVDGSRIEWSGPPQSARPAPRVSLAGSTR